MAKAKLLAEAEQASTNIWNKKYFPNEPVVLSNVSHHVANMMRRVTTDANVVLKRISWSKGIYWCFLDTVWFV